MKKTILLFLLLFISNLTFSQKKVPAFKNGEWLRYKLGWSNFLRAGTATLSLEESTLQSKKVFHVTGKGWTSGMIKWFFKVNDDYQSYFDVKTGKPYLFKRKINEGGYIKNKNTSFNYRTKKAYIQDFKNQKDTTVVIDNVQDVISMLYFLRNKDVSALKIGEEIETAMFIDSETTPFKLRFLGIEIINTKFGKVKAMKFRPFVQSGRIFKERETVTIWVTADENKIPIKIAASLSFGTLRAELEAYKGLANPFDIIYD